MFKSHCSVKLAALIVLALLSFASCGSGDGSQGGQSGGKDSAGSGGSTGSAQSETTAETTEGPGQQAGAQKGGGQKGGATTAQTATGAMKVREGSFRVDKAGTVEFQVNDNALDLQDVSPKSGWRQRYRPRARTTSRCISSRATWIGSSRSRSTPTAWISPKSRTSVRPEEDVQSRRSRRGSVPI
jgi:hypothetical protein